MQSKITQQAQRFFMTSISLITSYGPCGPNVMAAEWTMQISHKPMLIAVFIHKGSSTLVNIKKTKRFGVNVASEKQATLVSVAGGYSRKEIDKLKIRGLFHMTESKRGRLPLIANCLVNAECELHSVKKIGDHNMVVGKVYSIIYDESKKPLIYHRNRYFHVGKIIEPVRHNVLVNKKIFDEFCGPNQNKFILKCTGVLIRSKNMLLVLDDEISSQGCTIPYVRPQKNKDYKKELENYLKKMNLRVMLKEEPRIKRLIMKYKNKNQRINFILFEGTLENNPESHHWKTIQSD